MKKITKRIASVITACCMLISMSALFEGTSVSAVAYKCGDVNIDGKVSLADSVALGKFIKGKVELIDYARADVNSDRVVDVVDSQILFGFISETISSLPYFGYGGGPAYISDNTTHINGTVIYNKFDFNSNQLLGTYTLPFLPYPSINNTYQTSYPEDGRTEDNDLPGVVKIYKTGHTFTGFVVGDHAIATVAHGSSFSNISIDTSISKIVIIGTSGETLMEIPKADIKEIHFPNAYYVGSRTCKSYDYALITVSQNLSQYKCFNLGVMTDGAKGYLEDVYVTGFPKYVNNQLVNTGNLHKRYTSCGNVMRDEDVDFSGSGFESGWNELDQKRIFAYDNKITTAGNSGSPVYLKTTVGRNTYYSVIGIHSGSVGYDIDENNGYIRNGLGVRMTPAMIQFFLNNPNISY